jgi:hydrophobe/amphiphile efflux-1 (HAE1) family protein/NodT family efflux transporter outer membrane factor (OMF) lipoprotein
VSFSEPFIRRPIATTLLTVGLAMSGALAFRFLPVAPLPQVDFPTIQVSAALPGASPETMATSVAAPLERQFGHIAGVTEMTSTSYLGSTNVVLQFDLGRDINGAARDVQAAINAARGDLPPALPNNPTYRKVNPADAPILILALTSNTLGRGEMYDAASSVLQQKLSQVPGVGQVIVGGAALPAVRVELNPLALDRYGIGLEDVRAALGATNVNRPKGLFDDGGRTRQIQANDQIRHARDYAPVIVAYQNGRPVRIEDVGQAEESVEDVRNAGLSDGKPAVVVVIFRQPGANIIDTVDRVRALIPRFHAVIPAAIDLAVVLDRSTTIRASLRDVEWTLAISVALVTLVVFAFLRSGRTTAIPAVAVPVSLVGTFGAMYLLGYSLNNLSLMALTIATGFVIDDAIVVLENVTRHREAGLSALESALLGAREIGFTVLSMSVSLVAVFIPILLMGGVVGRLFREFAMTLSIAIAISLAVSLTTTPMLCALLLGGEPRGSHGRLYRLGERGFEWVRRSYERTLLLALRHQPLMLAATLATIALNGYLFTVVPKGFFPQQDTGRLTGTIRAAQDISFQAMQDKLGQIVGIIGKDPAVDNVIGFTGGGGNTGATVNTARMFIALKPLGERGASADQVIARLRGRLAAVPGAPTFLQAVQDLRVGGMASAAQYQYTLRGDNLAALDAWGPRVAQRLASLPALADLNSDQQDKGRQSSVVIDRATASRLGLTTQLVDDTLYDAFGQRQVSTMYTPLNQYHVVMEVAPRFWQRPETLADIYVRGPSGAAVPLAAFTRYEPTNAALAVSHQGQFPSVTLSFNLAPGASLGGAVEAIQDAARQIGLPANIQGSFQGTAQAFQASLAGEPLLILAALLAVYVALGVLYESYVHPLTILSTLPSAGVGALLALLLFRTDLSVIALIGIVLLIGIVKKNAIMMIDFALDAERREGRSPEDAIFQACLLRFRPITMTTMAALLGALPLALGTGVGSELRRPLGIAIVGGLIVSQMLTLYTTPVVYLWLARMLERRRRVARATAPAGTLALLLVAVLVAGGCTVGPSYVRPPIVAPAAYKETDGWKVARPQDDAIRGDWWELFGDAELSALEGRVGVSNQSLAAAEATYREARALVREARAGYFPTVTVGAGYTRFRSSANAAFGSGSAGALTGASATGGPQSDFQLPFDVSWTPDFWGRVRRAVESNQASAQASAGDLETARLSLQAELAQDYFQLRALDAQSETLTATVAAFAKSLQLTKDRYASGIASGADVAQALTQLKTTQAQAIDVGVQRAQLEHAIALLIGEPASTFTLSRAPLAAPPPDVPVGVPSALLERRPDVAAAERRAAAANAAVGVAVAAFYPTVTLSASAGFQSGSLAQWLAWPSRFWSVGPGISETVYDGGLRRAQTDQARAAYDASVASYRQTVLAAFQGVEDNLAALRILEDEARVQDEAVDAASRSLSLTTDQYKAGIVSYLNVVVAQTALLTNQTAAVAIRGRRMTATVLLIQALGGGWSAARLPSAAAVTTRTGGAGSAR